MGSANLKINTNDIDFSDSFCVVIDEQKNITVYNNLGSEVKYTAFGNEYKPISESNNAPQPEQVCYTEQEVRELTSEYDFMNPIYQNMAVLSVGLIFIIAITGLFAVFGGLGRKKG